MNVARTQKRLDGPPPDYPVELPKLRKKIVIIDYDFEQKVIIFDLYRTSHRDCYHQRDLDPLQMPGLSILFDELSQCTFESEAVIDRMIHLFIQELDLRNRQN